MTSFHSLFPELAMREVRCLHFGPGSALPAGEYIYLEFYCEDLACDCRRMFLQVISPTEPGRVFASINYGWEKESFYRKRMPYDPEAATGLVKGELDPINEQSEFAELLLKGFQEFVLDEVYRLRVRRHHRLFREELARRAKGTARDSTGGNSATPEGGDAGESERDL
ncbi:MAG TPA: hypothetical protein PKK20_10420 [Verrucomicrobiota bacterium]|jgi:hypothetical protein|nr:MAG: hypothetical protein BWX48_03480 [Verrucomicrobia bacterium ADurb.Bin006]HNV00342.1 hypothetical protein [Verrucomicrobiota bacterium]HOA62541.1 hypothetical protein [Verrucomicrobiota bacterium]HOF49750.1 hypothetical protein [Verrucomicrobiota bacterium]HOG88470.1 hypothetical protein [Verrucomicrobiota bacterium]